MVKFYNIILYITIIMIKGIGVDIVQISRIEKILQRFANKFLRRVFTTEEITNSNKYHNRANYFAKRFAAKEAYVKAIGTGFSKHITMRDVAVHNDHLGKPFIIHNNIIYHNLSLSDDGDYAIAFVIVEK